MDGYDVIGSPHLLATYPGPTLLRMEGRAIKILWIEDSDDDVFLLTRAMYRSRNPAAAFQHVWNGEEGMHFLQGRGMYADRAEFPLPDVIVTDMKMPRVNGVKFLEWLRGQQQFNRIPVLVLSGSALVLDVTSAMSLGAHGYVRKPDREPAWEKLYATVLAECRQCLRSTK